MAEKWYPVIDYSKCSECGTCVEFCPHGVYDKVKSPSPVVVYPEGCIQGCHGCGNKCPEGAIEYVGDNTGWKPKNGKTEETSDCGCGCTCGEDIEGGCCS